MAVPGTDSVNLQTTQGWVMVLGNGQTISSDDAESGNVILTDDQR